MMRLVGIQYNRYINSPEWQTKRLERLNHDNRRCFQCDATVGLEVHHITYRAARPRAIDRSRYALPRMSQEGTWT